MIRLLFLPMFLGFTTALLFEGKLTSVHIVFRHGDSVQNISHFYPFNPNEPHDYDPLGHSNLTNTGRLRAYKFGEYLRKRYNDFLGTEYRREDVYARSSHPECARASLLTVLASLYPPEGSQKWHPTLNWQPISIESPESEIDDPLLRPISCATYIEANKAVQYNPDYMQSFLEFCVENFKHLRPDFDLSYDELTYLYKKLLIGIDDDDDTGIPEWDDVSPCVIEKIARDVAVMHYRAQNYNEKLMRLNGGMLLRKMIDDMKAVIDGKPMPKISLYSGHEFNVVALLNAVDAWKPIVPTYTSAAILELWKRNGEYYVKVFYHDGFTRETKPRWIIECSSSACPFEELNNLLQKKATLPESVAECYPCDMVDHQDQCVKEDIDYGDEMNQNERVNF